MSESAADLARMWDNRTCPDQGMADQCLYAGGIEDYYLVTQRCECGRVAFLECDMGILPEGGLHVIVPHSATQRPSIHTSTRCADAVDWDSLRGESDE